MISLLLIARDEAAGLLAAPGVIRGMPVYEEALPPPAVLGLMLKQKSEWTIPRLFVDEEQLAVVGSGGFKRYFQETDIMHAYVQPMLQGSRDRKSVV